MKNCLDLSLFEYINCSSDLKNFSLEFKSFSPSLEQFLVTVGQKNFDNKIPFFIDIHVECYKQLMSLVLFCFWADRIILGSTEAAK